MELKIYSINHKSLNTKTNLGSSKKPNTCRVDSSPQPQAATVNLQNYQPRNLTPEMEDPSPSPSKRMKKSPSILFEGFQFLAKSGLPLSLDSGVFRENICRFIQECTNVEDYDLEGMNIWRTFLTYEKEGKHVPLYIVEDNLNPKKIARENLKENNPYKPFCSHCCSTGWSRHIMSKTNYHFIIPANDEWNNPLDEGTFDLQTHLLHGLIHTNGYGHLICINGIEGGSEFIRGTEIMNLWDSICTSLRVRKISVKDMSMKHGMDLRLLYAVAYGESWFGGWGYRLCHDSFGVTDYDYRIALNALSLLEIDRVIEDFNLTDEDHILKRIIDIRRQWSGAGLVTVREMFSSMLGSNCPNSLFKMPRYKKFSDLAVNSERKWPVKALENVADFLVQCMEKDRAIDEASRMTRQEAFDMADKYIEDKELIEYVLKLMNNVVVENYIVRREVNKHRKTQEYYGRLHKSSRL